MADNVHYLTPRQEEIGHYLRLGHTGYRILENLHAVGRLPIKRAVIDASHITAQIDLISCLKDSGAELSLDTKSAELAYAGGFTSAASNLPWAPKNQPYQFTDFRGRSLNEYCEKIATFAVAHQFDVVHCATHEIKDANDPWLKVDANICLALRQALDRSGGQRIQIDYPIIIPYGIFHKESECKTILERLANLPYENLWLRISNFGMTSATPAGLFKYIQSAWLFRLLRKPIVADGVAGLVGTSLIAFGAVGGICHGIGDKTDFRTYHWKKPSTDGGGSGARIYLPEIDLYLYKDQAQTLLQGRGAKSLLACNDANCCANEPQNMFKQHRAHALTQSVQLISGFNNTPEARWVDFLTREHLKPTGRTLRKVEKLKLSEPKLTEKLKYQSHRLDLMDQAIDRLYENTKRIPLSLKPIKRHIKFPSFGRIG